MERDATQTGVDTRRTPGDGDPATNGSGPDTTLAPEVGSHGAGVGRPKDETADAPAGGVSEDNAQKAPAAGGDSPQTGPPGEALADEIEADLYGRLGYSSQQVTLQTLDGDTIVCFEGVPSGGEDDESFAAVLSADSGQIEELIIDLDNYPETFYLPEEDLPEDTEGGSSRPAEGRDTGGSCAAILKLVVDPEPEGRLARRYGKAGLTVVPDARYAAQMIAAALEGTDPTKALQGASADGALQETGYGAEHESAAASREDPRERSRRARRRSSVYKTRIELTGAAASTAGAQTVMPSEHLEAIKRYNETSAWQRLYNRIRYREKIAYPELGVQLDWRCIQNRALQMLLENGPAIAVLGASKGGVGKSTCALNLAVAIAQMGRPVEKQTKVGKPPEWSSGLRVLLLEMNLDNPCLGKRLNPSGAKLRGLYEYREELKRYGEDYAGYEAACERLRSEDSGTDADADERMPSPPAEPDLVEFTTELGGVPGLDVMFVGGESADLDRMEEELNWRELEDLISAASLSYEVIVVDLDKGRSNRQSLSSELNRFWLSRADTYYVMTDKEKSSIEWATEFAEDARDYFDDIEAAAAESGRPAPRPFRMVPVANMWLAPHERPSYGVEGADWAEEGADPWVSAFDTIPADTATDEQGREIPFIRVPRDEQVAEYNRVGKAIATESERFRDGFQAWAIDFISCFIHEVSGGGGRSGGAHEYGEDRTNGAGGERRG